MRISDWSSDVCSSDLNAIHAFAKLHRIDWRDGFEFLNQPERGEPGLDQYLNYMEEWYRWAAKRSEEHTSELQSLMRISYAVFCLKKKKTLNIKSKHIEYHK